MEPLSAIPAFQRPDLSKRNAKLSGFDINIDLIDKSVNARLSTTATLFTAAMMDLSAYDMLFDLVTWDELQDAIVFVHQQHLAVLALYGLSLDYDAMMNLITLHSDETMMERVSQEHAG